MQKLAMVTGVLVAALCGALLPLALSSSGLTAQAPLYIGLFVSAALVFVVSIVCHPGRTSEGTTVSVSLGSVHAAAAPWTVVLYYSFFVALTVSWLWVGKFTINSASLAGHPERQVALLLFFATFHSAAAMVASSALRWPPQPRAAGDGNARE